MDVLREMRSAAGPKLTVGLNDTYVEKFLARDLNLSMAINNAYQKWKKLDPVTTYKRPEGLLIKELQDGWCHLYPEDTRNPYIPLAAKGPWIVTMHGAVLHDNGGYGMLGFGHGPTEIIEAMAEDHVMANIMTPSLAQKRFIDALNKEIGHNRANGNPYVSFILMNSGSEGNSVADRLIDIHTGHYMQEEKNKDKKVKCIALKGCFHGRTYRPALWTDACKGRYNSANVYSIMQSYKEDYCWICEVNDVADLERLFEKAEKENVFIEAMFVESVMGEGNPGVAITPEFFAAARRLTLKHDGMLLVDNIQAGIRTTGNLSIVDYPGFENLDCPDFEVYSKAINGGQYPVSCLAISPRGQKYYRHGVYGNTMTGNPRACSVSAAVLSSIDQKLRDNIVNMGKYALEQYRNLQKEFPDLITSVTGTGLLYAVQLNDSVFAVVANDGAEYVLRKQGLGVIHGGHNALRFTPHFKITKEEMDMQVDFVRAFLQRLSTSHYQLLVPRLAPIFNKKQDEFFRTVSPTVNNYMNATSEKKQCAMTDRLQVSVKGHLFDENILGELLNIVEKFGGTARIVQLHLGADTKEASEGKLEILLPSTKEKKELVGALETSKNNAFIAVQEQPEEEPFFIVPAGANGQRMVFA